MGDAQGLRGVRLQEVEVGNGMGRFMRDGFITRQVVDIEQTHGMGGAELSKDRTENWMSGCFWIIRDQTNVHRLGAPSISADRLGGARRQPIGSSCAARHGACPWFEQPSYWTSAPVGERDRKSTRLNSSHRCISYSVFFL